MTDWIFDPFSSPESDPEFGLLPKPRLRKFLTSHLGLSTHFRSPLREVLAAGLRQRLGMAQRELDVLHALERLHLLTDAARIKAHHHEDAGVRARARAIWAGLLLPEKDWRDQCREEILAGRDGRYRTPRLLRRLLRTEVKDWPSPANLVRAALLQRASETGPLDLARATFAHDPAHDSTGTLIELWTSAELGPEERVELLRTLAVLHEFAGENEKAVRCWTLLIQRDAENFLAHISRFSIALFTADAEAARDAAWSLQRIGRRSENESSLFSRALRERAWINRAVKPRLTPESGQLRLELLATGEPTLTELCLGLV